MPSFRAVAALALVVCAATLALWLPGLGEMGWLAEAEMPTVDRARAALGEPLRDLVRAPALPDALRVTGMRWFSSSELGGRLPHALAAAAACGCAAALAVLAGFSRSTFAAAVLMLWACPGLVWSGRTVLGNPWLELGVGLVIAAAVGLSSRPAKWRSVAGLVALGLTGAGLGCAAGGVVHGLLLPMTAVLTCWGLGRVRPQWALGWGLWLGLLGTSVWLLWHQGDGYIPWIGASKDLDILDDPSRRGFGSGLELWGYQTFPLLPLALVGLASTRTPAWIRTWLAASLAITCAWSAVLGGFAAPVQLPTVLCASAGLHRLADQEQPAIQRRFATMLVFLGCLILAKDAGRTPSEVGMPLFDVAGEHNYPDDALHVGAVMGRFAKLAALAALSMPFVAAWLRRRQHPNRARRTTVVTFAFLFLAQGLWLSHGLIPRSAELLSTRSLLATYEGWRRDGLTEGPLLVQGVRDRSLPMYTPEELATESIKTQTALQQRLAKEEPVVALVAKNRVPGIYSYMRRIAKRAEDPGASPQLQVYSERHAHLALIGNQPLAGVEDHNPIRDVVFDAPPQLRHETRVRFDDLIEITGWEISTPVVRGGEVTIKLALHVLKDRIPSSAKIVARLARGRTSRLNPLPHELTAGVYPPTHWRKGDHILHSYTFKAPLVEILSAEHQVIVALQRREGKNAEITIPEQEHGEFRVRIRNLKKRTHATIGYVDVY